MMKVTARPPVVGAGSERQHKGGWSVEEEQDRRMVVVTARSLVVRLASDERRCKGGRSAGGRGARGG